MTMMVFCNFIQGGVIANIMQRNNWTHSISKFILGGPKLTICLYARNMITGMVKPTVPLLPLLLINGADAIGSGWSEAKPCTVVFP